MKRTGEKGSVLILVMVFMLVGMLIITPLLNFMATGLQVGRTYEMLMNRQYAADGGVEQALWRIQNGLADETPFSISLNGCVVDVAIERALTELEFLGGIAAEPVGQIYHATHPHFGESELELVGTVDGNIATIVVTYTGETKSKNIQAFVFWLSGQYEFVRNIEGLNRDPELVKYAAGTSFIWKPMAFSLDAGESVTFSFEFSGGTTPFIVAMVELSSDIWLVADDPMEFYVVKSTATDVTDKEITVESVIISQGDDIGTLTYQFK